MRQIHPIGFQEKFVASGIYKYGYTDDAQKPLKIIEHWSIHQLPDESHLIRSDWDARDEFGESRLVEILRNSEANDRRVERFDIYRYLQFASTFNNYPKVTKASYIFFEDYVQIGRKTDDDRPQQTEIHFTKNVYVNPGVHADQRFVLELAEQRTVNVAVFHPNFVLDSSEALDGVIKDCSASSLGLEILTILERPLTARHYQLKCAEEIRTDYWFDEYGTLLRYDKGVMRALLVQYARRPEPPTS